MADWSEIEVELIIADYFQMLQKEISNIPYSKSEHRRNLQKLLNNRSDGSVEFKHQNISAVFINNGFPYIKGYKPRFNYQHLLEEKVLAYLNYDTTIEKNFQSFANQQLEYQEVKIKYDTWIDVPPESNLIKEPKVNYNPKIVKRNYLELEQKNRSIGEFGEQLVLEYEKWRLKSTGLTNYIKDLVWVSRELGDGAGYDILSKKEDGSDIFIEVKSTTLGKEAPIFFSKRENDFSNEKREFFYLYRVFDIKSQPKMFKKNGRFQDICNIEPVNFKGSF